LYVLYLDIAFGAGHDLVGARGVLGLCPDSSGGTGGNNGCGTKAYILMV
jgi:hypothetical protein